MTTLTDRLLVVIDATSAGAVQELDKLQSGAKKSGDAFDSIGKKAGVAGSTIKAGLVAGAAAFVGTGLVSFLQDSVDAFGDSAKAAGELASATGGTVDEVSRMQAALKGAGITAEQSSGLMTKFTTNAGKNAKLLGELGVTMKTNADGSVDYADGMVQAVDAINKMGDSSKRNQALVQLFGKAGAAAFNELADSGISLSESMRLVNKYQVFTAADVRKAQAYDDAMDNLGASMQGVQFAIGEMLVPALSAVADTVTGVVDFIMNIPGPVKDLGVAAALAAVGLFGMSKALAAIKSEQAGVLFVTMLDGVAKLAGAFFGVEGAAAKAGVAVRGMGTAMKAAMVSAGPLLALIGMIEIAMNTLSEGKRWQTTVFSNAAQSLSEQAKILQQTDSVLDSIIHPDWGANTGDVKRVTDSWRDMADATLEAADSTETERKAAQDLKRVIDAGNLGTDEGTAAMQAYAEAVGASAAASAEAQAAQTDLNDLIAQGVTGGQELADAATAAADAQRGQESSARAAEAAMLAYDTSIYGVIGRMIELNDTSLDDAKTQLENLDFTQVGSKWVDEAEVAAKNATTIILNELKRASEDAPGLDPVAFLQDLREGAPPEIQKVIDGMIAQFQADPVTSEVGVVLDPKSAGDTKTDIEGVAEDQESTVTVTTVFADGGYNANKARKDYLKQDVSGLINIQTVFADGGYNANKARVDYLAQNRTAYIDIVVRGQAAARRTLDGLAPATTGPTQHATTAVPVTNNWSVTINGASDPRRTVRALERYMRDNGRPQSVVVRA